ncbi:hypothetical protein E3O47_07575 [Cryobacterium sp. TMT2-17-1]|uniref:hypothetical protein n=1 Tax=Cryobacterium sp. TMT2-17-1 TaxID=1259248 RepID=UPI00106C0A6C|nr:hypothetical protein [Cryobacterium sp. TMT2-17-1]TFC50859.1 hypothetical protein E3O47_07575 [Cryobacterium sp. TMT2-17-1]
MSGLKIVPTSDLYAAVTGDAPSPAVFDATELQRLFDLSNRAGLLVGAIDDPDAAEAIRLLSYAVNSAAMLLTTIASAIHNGGIGLINYPEAIAPLAGVVWRVESQQGKEHLLEKAQLHPAGPSSTSAI